MPLSWLPLISDYTREAAKPVRATAVSVVTYSIVSIFMYTIGMGAALFTGESDIASILVKAGLGVVGLLIVIFQRLRQHSLMLIQPVYHVCLLLPKSRKNGLP